MKHFKLEEFESPDLPGSGNKMNEKFLKMIDEAREIADITFVITSGYRTEEHNKKVGGKNDSSHLHGYAADIACTTSRQRALIVMACIAAGFTRIGIAKTFIHIDNDPGKVGRVFWVY